MINLLLRIILSVPVMFVLLWILTIDIIVNICRLPYTLYKRFISYKSRPAYIELDD